MTTPSFEVDVDALELVLTKLAWADSAMLQALQAMHFTGGADYVGTEELDDACNAFQSIWQYGLAQINEEVAETIKGLRSTKDAYVQVDQIIADMYRSAQDNPPQAPPPVQGGPQ